ncbi:MAG: DNA translocase FtsK [Thermodesulfobacteriota bacterium]
MPVHLNVRQIREALFAEVGTRAKLPEPSAQQRLAGKLFHECFAALILSLAESSGHRLQRWTTEQLEMELYARHFGPRLIEHLVHFRNDTRCVKDFWTACRNMCRWLAGLMESAESNRVELLFHPEEAFSMELVLPHWSDTVVLSGVADLVVRFETLPHWCLVELKFSRSLPELDLAQACLYHMMAQKVMPRSVGKLALVRFSPEPSETLLDEGDIARIRPRLIEWIGKLAGVRNGRSQPSAGASSASVDEKIVEQARRIEEIFHEYGLQVRCGGEPISGPCFIRYPIRLGKGVKIGAVQKTAAEIQHRLGVDTPPFIHLSEGQVFVDLQRPDRQTIHFRDVLGQLRKSGIGRGCSRIMLGVDLFNRLHTADLAQPEHAHFLIAGTTGSGKTEWLRTALAGLIATNSPKTLKLVIIDPKRNGFSDLQGSPFLWNDSSLVYPDEQPVADALAALADEMDRRYRHFEQAQVDHLDAFNQSYDPPLPRIVCICDEYADLINRDREERRTIEARINRLGQKARSAGIHLLIATQHPSRQIVRGTLDANLPARIGFKMNRDIESKMVLNQRGAEHLLGAGDMLFKSIGEIRRLQAPLMRSEERVRFLTGDFYRDKPDV